MNDVLVSQQVLGRRLLTNLLKSMPPVLGGVTNVGIIDETKIYTDKIKVNSINIEVLGAASFPFCVAVLSFKEELNISFTYSQKMMAPKIANSIINKFKERITLSCHSKRQHIEKSKNIIE